MKLQALDSTPWYVIGIGNTHFLTVGQGYVKDTMMIDGAEVSITMKIFFLVPKLGINLFFIRALTNEGVKAVLTKNQTSSYRNGSSELTGQRTDNILNYLINITAKAADDDSALTANSILPFTSWHKGLDNVSNRRFEKDKPKNVCTVSRKKIRTGKFHLLVGFSIRKKSI